MTTLAHAGHWLVNLIYVAPVALVALGLAFQSLRDRRAGGRQDGTRPEAASGAAVAVVLCEEEPASRAALRRRIATSPGLALVGEHSSRKRLPPLVDALDADVVVIGPTTGRRAGIVELIESLHDLAANPAVALVTGPDADVATAPAEVDVVLAASSPDADFAAAIRRAARPRQ